MKYKNLLLEKDGPIAILTMNRPQALNALNEETLYELDAAIDVIAGDDEVQALIITGEGRAFVAGADIAAMQPKNSMEAQAFGLLGQNVMSKIEGLPKPSIAAINGFALGGGCELALACDIRVASEKAVLGQPEVGLAIIPGFGGTQRLPRLVGEGIAKELILTGDNINAERALAIGLVNHVVPAEELLDFSKNLARRIISKGPLAVQLAKQAINEGMQVDIDRGMTLERSLFALCFSTYDQKEGMMAFLEKRKADFQKR